MLTSTEKILSVVALALTFAVGFSLLQYNSAMDEMAQLRQEQVEHVDMVNQEFKQRVKAVELANIGQGKEIKRGQDRITANTKLIYTKADSLGSLIDDLAYEIKRVDRDLSKKIKNVQTVCIPTAIDHSASDFLIPVISETVSIIFACIFSKILGTAVKKVG